MADKVTMYGHPACMMVPPVQAMLKRCKVDFDYINIYRDPEARQRVRDINGGDESVPTLVFSDGSTLTEPSAANLRSTLIEQGYDVPLSAWLTVNIYKIVLLIILILLMLNAAGVI